jgi:hypothetical protein
MRACLSSVTSPSVTSPSVPAPSVASLGRVLSLAAAVAVVAGCASRASAGWESLGGMPGAKHHAFAIDVSGTQYVIGGPPWVAGSDSDGTVYRRLGGAWSVVQPIDGEGPVLGLGGGIDALGRIVLFGGINSENGDIAGGKVYDPSQGTAGSIADRPDMAPPSNFAVARDDLGRLYTIGGGNGTQGGNTGFVARYVASGDLWQTLANLPVGVANAAACDDGEGHILLFGGLNAAGTARSAEVWRYDIATNVWSSTAVPDLPVALSHAVAVRGRDARIYLVGGESGPVGAGTVLATTSVYHLLDHTWSTGPSMALPRRDHAAVLGSDDFVYAFGGTTSGGVPTASVERLFAPTCPSFFAQTPSNAPWLGQTVTLGASVGGGQPMTFRWLRDGEALVDGPAPGGGTISGATTPSLTITLVGPADVGAYRLEATNACGMATSEAIELTLRTPPTIPAHWTVTNLHPAWAESSGANCVQNGRQGGAAVQDVAGYNNLQQPVLWEGSAASAQNITPAGSVGGAVFDMDGDMLVGSWWWPFSCQVSGQWYTCYYWQACRWIGVGSPQGLVHDQLQVSGWDIGSAVVAKDGLIGGSQTPEEGLPGASGIVWSPPNYSGWPMSVPGTGSSFVSGLDAGDAYGSIHTPNPGTAVHAAKFVGGVGTNWVDLHPAGFSSSGISDADEGQQVGGTGYYSDAKAAIWYGSALSHQSIHPRGAIRSGATACMDGVQVGYAVLGTLDHAVIWNGSAESVVDLHAFLPNDFTASSAADIEVGADGSMVVVGAAYRASLGRWEAVMWTSGSAALVGDISGDGVVDAVDLGLLLGAWGTGDAAADLNGDGMVDGSDLAILLGAWV